MMDLILWRHARGGGRPKTAGDDLAARLTPRGEKQGSADGCFGLDRTVARRAEGWCKFLRGALSRRLMPWERKFKMRVSCCLENAPHGFAGELCMASCTRGGRWWVAT